MKAKLTNAGCHHRFKYPRFKKRIPPKPTFTLTIFTNWNGAGEVNKKSSQILGAKTPIKRNIIWF